MDIARERVDDSATTGLGQALSVLRQHWGHRDFRPAQRDVVAAVLAGRDTLAVLPTGGGKSVCYQVPAVLRGGLTVVVSPLIALMQDQVAGLRARGVSATFINSQLSSREIEQRWVDAEHGLYRLLYVAPERFSTELFRHRASRLDVRLLAVDEAHCISEWGPDFRPAYFEIAGAAAMLGQPPVIAVTATATPEVRRDIIARLELRSPAVFVAGFDRPNVVPSVFHTSAKLEKLLEVLGAVPGTAIVYVSTRGMAENLAARLKREGHQAVAYHAGLPAAVRMGAQESWQAGEIRVIVATNAFGMGIDKPDVRLVVHYDIPLSIEAYYQEAGRAGRDGKTSYAVLLFGEGDAKDAHAFVEQARPEREVVQRVYETALSIARVAIGSACEEPFLVDPEQVASITKYSPMAVRAAIDALERADAWRSVRLGDHRGMIRFLLPPDAVRGKDGGNGERSRLVQQLLRSVPGEAFQEWVVVDFKSLARRIGLETVTTLQFLDSLAQRGLLVYHAPGDGLRLQLVGPRLERAPVDARALRRNRAHGMRRLADMLRYARSITCRRSFLLRYFGEATPGACGSCDICLGRHRPVVVSPDDEKHLMTILRQVQQGDPADAWLASEELPRQRILGLGDWLLSEGYIELADPLTETYRLTEAGRRFLS